MSLSAAVRLLTQRPRIISATTTANWNGGVATSGQPGADLFTYGQANRWWRLAEAYLVLAAFNPLATVTIRAYMTVAGAVRTIMNENWVVALDGELAYIVWFWDVEILGPLRVEVFSNQAADNGLAAPYEYKVKDW